MHAFFHLRPGHDLVLGLVHHVLEGLEVELAQVDVHGCFVLLMGVGVGGVEVRVVGGVVGGGLRWVGIGMMLDALSCSMA